MRAAVRLQLQEGASRLAEVEAEAARSARELAEFKAESSQLRNQDLTIRRLEERARLLEAALQEKVRIWIQGMGIRLGNCA